MNRITLDKFVPSTFNAITETEFLHPEEYERGTIIIDGMICQSCRKVFSVRDVDCWYSKEKDDTEKRTVHFRCPHCNSTVSLYID